MSCYMLVFDCFHSTSIQVNMARVILHWGNVDMALLAYGGLLSGGLCSKAPIFNQLIALLLPTRDTLMNMQENILLPVYHNCDYTCHGAKWRYSFYSGYAKND